MAKKQAGKKELKMVVTVPDVGLSKAEINRLKRVYKNEWVKSMGGEEKVALLPWIIVIVVVVVTIRF